MQRSPIDLGGSPGESHGATGKQACVQLETLRPQPQPHTAGKKAG
ncbi:hypothetical protein [Skermania sp. ID1734]|nr:hypothetical protein [Skermania sp. ID1734]